MKRHTDLWNKIVSIENLENAHYNASKGKQHYSEVKAVNEDVRLHIARLRRSLVQNNFTTSPYKVSEIFDGNKLRTIHKLPYWPDRVVHHALMSVIEPILRRSLIRDTFQSIKGRGSLDAFKRLRNTVQYHPLAHYAVKLDVTKFYPSVDNAILKTKIKSKIKCRRTLALIDDIIDSTRGLPIGNYTSQIFGNFYLSEIDWFVKQQLKPVGYFRYCDDIVVLTETSAGAKEAASQVTAKLEELNLEVKPPVFSNVHQNGIDFVGYLLRPTHSKVRRSIATSFRRCTVDKSKPSYKGWFLHNRSLPFFNKHTKEIL